MAAPAWQRHEHASAGHLRHVAVSAGHLPACRSARQNRRDDADITLIPSVWLPCRWWRRRSRCCWWRSPRRCSTAAPAVAMAAPPRSCACCCRCWSRCVDLAALRKIRQDPNTNSFIARVRNSVRACRQNILCCPPYTVCNLYVHPELMWAMVLQQAATPAEPKFGVLMVAKELLELSF